MKVEYFNKQKLGHGGSYSPVQQNMSPSLQRTALLPRKTAIITYTEVIVVAFVSIFLPFLFFLIVLQHGGIVAPPNLSNLVLEYPRYSAFVVTIFCSILSGLVRWTYSSIITQFGRKRLVSGYREIAEIAVLSALKNGGIFVSWKRRYATLATILSALASGLLTAGFVYLFSPLFTVSILVNNLHGRELDFIETEKPSCIEWSNIQATTVLNNDNCVAWTEYKGFKFSTCINDQQHDILDAAKASMLAYIHSRSDSTLRDPSNVMFTYSRLNRTQFFGSTSGVLPFGPGGMSALGDMDISVIPRSVLTSSEYNYTFILQGGTLGINCEYEDHQFFSRPSAGNFSWHGVRCPETGAESGNEMLDAGGGMLAVAICPPEPSLSYNIHIKSWRKGDDMSDWKTRNKTYTGIGNTVCHVTPKLGTLEARYISNLHGFQIKKEQTGGNSLRSAGNLAEAYLLSWPMEGILNSIHEAQTNRAGHTLALMINSEATAHFPHLDGETRDELYPILLGEAIKGIFEYYVTYLRLTMTAFGTPPPEECYRNVPVYLNYRAVGWSANYNTALSLIPLFLLGIIILVLLYLTTSSHHSLPSFDPTNPTSLVAAAAAGGLQFHPQSVGLPDDEEVCTTTAVYGMTTSGGRWGLIEGRKHYPERS